MDLTDTQQAILQLIAERIEAKARRRRRLKSHVRSASRAYARPSTTWKPGAGRRDPPHPGQARGIRGAGPAGRLADRPTACCVCRCWAG
jgi:hypothetical protein